MSLVYYCTVEKHCLKPLLATEAAAQVKSFFLFLNKTISFVESGTKTDKFVLCDLYPVV